jgi:hypothetical protein
MLQTRCVHIWQQQQTGAPRHSQQQHHSSACAQPPCHAPQSCSLTNYVYLPQGDPLSAAQFLELGALCVAHHTTKESLPRAACYCCCLLLLATAAACCGCCATAAAAAAATQRPAADSPTVSPATRSVFNAATHPQVPAGSIGLNAVQRKVGTNLHHSTPFSVHTHAAQRTGCGRCGHFHAHV